MIFKNRLEAGQKLAEKLIKYKDQKNILVIGLPRGGLILAQEIAKKINSSLDIVVPRKIGAPNNPEFAIGAITEEGESFLNEDIIDYYKISKEYIAQEIAQEKKEAQRRLKVYRGEKEATSYKDKIIILVDDGIATGSTMLAALAFLKKKKVKKIIVAVPVLARDTIKIIEKEVEELIYLEAPLFFGAIGAFYKEFDQTTDQEVIAIMKNYNVPK